MISYWGEDIAYDELGNPLNWINGETLTWQNGRQLASVDGVSYGYNADGLRVSKTWSRGSTEYYVVDGQYIGEKTVNNGTQYYIYYIYDENGSPAGITVNGTQYWFVKNLQGDVTAILDSSGTVAANYRYDAYGYIISITNGSGANVGLTDTGHIARLNPFRYRGYMYDEETGFYYLRSRYYDPYIGRFINSDDRINDDILGVNLYAYCSDNPVLRIDDSGHGWWIPVSALVGGLVGGASKIVTNLIFGETWYEGVLGAALGGATYGGVLAATGNVWAAGYAGAAVESITNEVISYCPIGQSNAKELNSDNLSTSLKTVFGETVINGTIMAVSGEFSNEIVPTNKNWYKPQKFTSCIVGNYAVKSELQTLTQAVFSVSIYTIKRNKVRRLKQCQDTQETLLTGY